MPSLSEPIAVDSIQEHKTKTNKIDSTASFFIILGFVSLLLSCSLPILLSYSLWVAGDRSSHLNLDFLIFMEHRIPGVTACYSYGLLPVLIQHVAFLFFGRDYKPMLACALAADVVYVVFWTLLLRNFPRENRWLVAIIAITPILYEVNPVLAYCIAEASMLFALLFVLKGRLPLAFAVSTVGCFGVPSLPIMLTTLLGGCIVIEWWAEGTRQAGLLFRRLLPGVLTYGALFLGLGLFFGFKAMLATATPINGARYYHEAGWLGLTRSMIFFHPAGFSLKYYLAYYTFSPVTWFMFAVLLLGALCLVSLPKLFETGRFHPARLCMTLCLAIIVVYLLVAFGNRGQQNIYEPILALGALVAIASLPERPRNLALGVFLVLGVLGEAGQAGKTVIAWRTTKPSPITYNLYADPGFVTDLAHVVDLSRSHKLLLLSYATGQHLYHPTIESPDVWFLLSGLMFSAERQRVLNQLDAADIVAIDLGRPHTFQFYDSDIRPRLAAMCLISVTENFRIFEKPGLEAGPCIKNGVAP